MAESTIGTCEPERLGVRLLRAVRPLIALMVAALPVVASAPGCGGDDPGPGGAAGGAATDPGDFQIDLELPPDIEARLLEIATELGAAICERGRNCCDHYGFEPRTDCVQLGGTLFAIQLVSATDLGNKDPSEFDFSIDEAMAERCVQVARSVSNECVLPREVGFEWYRPCWAVLGITPKGEEPVECDDDIVCEGRHGPTHGCVDHRCRPIVEVEQGAPCGPPNEGDIIPVCAASHYCATGAICQPRSPLGGPCSKADECVPGTYCDAGGDATATCVAGLPLGAPCRGAGCAEGLVCGCTAFGCDERVCAEPRGAGAACTTGAECPYPTPCEDGICKPPSLFFCEEP